ncbi:MAG: ATP-binding cassette domain-containing protein [Eubacteriales bacterium]|nr:ATP-binding cassette domain-containing protein [Eubacteriales bacterium]
MNNIVEVQNVSKSYDKQKVLKNVSVNFAEQAIHGLVGRNGSGKTMLLESILGLISCDEGKILVRGQEVGKDFDFPPNVGMLIERPGFLPYETGKRNLKMLAMISGKISMAEIDHAIRLVGLDPADKKKVSEYSLGMRQRLGIAQAIMENPELLILDEPLSGLDTNGVKEMHKVFRDLRNQGKTILIATHSQEDISNLCDTVHRMELGKITKL